MQNHVKAIELLQDWAKWLVGLDSAAIAAIGALTTRPSYELQTMSIATLVCGACATGLFLASLAFANWLLLALPGVVQRASEQSSEDIFAQGTYGGVGRRVVFFARGQHVFFLSGMVAGVAFVIAPQYPFCSWAVLGVSLLGVVRLGYEFVGNPSRFRVSD
jgi:hypothetical protein